MGSLDGKVALVTGASRGIGRAIALELARAGARVAINYRSGEAQARSVAADIVAFRTASAAAHGAEGRARAIADEVVARAAAVGIASSEAVRNGEPTMGEVALLAQADVSSPEEARSLVGRIVDRWGRIDVLVNNAGITRDRSLRKLGDEDWQTVICTNLNSVFYCTSAAIPVMMDQNYGRIVNISSVIGQAGNFGQANYSAAKGGIIAFTKSAALELARYNITVNAICPGFTATEMVMKVPEHIQDQIKAKIPLGRFAQPEEIARTVLFLTADGDYITGQQINVNGGIYM